MDRKIYILIGTPCAGKSTYINTVLKDLLYNPYIASTDNIIMSLHSDKTYDEAFELEKNNFEKLESIMFYNIYNSIENNQDIVIDRTNMKRKSRKRFLQITKDKYEKIAVVFKIDETEFDKRNNDRFLKEGKSIPKNVFHDMLKSYQEPSYEEGFNKILFI